MKNKKVIISVVLIIVLVVGIFGASKLYKKLSEDYKNSDKKQETTTVENTTEQQEGTTLSKDDEVETTSTKAADNSEVTTAKAEDSTENSSTKATDNVETTTVESTTESTTVTETTEEDNSDKEKVPEFTVYDTNGNEVKLSDFLGKPVMINFWATWCGPCRAELPYFDSAYQKYGDEIEFVMINLTDGYDDTKESVKNFVEESGYTFPYYYDTNNEAGNVYGIYSIPTTICVDKEGYLIGVHIGSMSEEEVYGIIDEAFH